ncbi:MAG: hypothetical protein J1D87_02465 [Lachnospiraceae bacterium]|nr:hypothetical protein [Lachnospiraceae bacterium]
MKYIIFGAGWYGGEALSYYGIKNVAFFCDNYKSGNRFEGIEIIDFEKLLQIYQDYRIVIAAMRADARLAIQKQLEEHGIEYENFYGTDARQAEENNFSGKYHFTDRSKGREKLLIILAGYKEFLWDGVFTRLRKYIPDDIDVCVLTAGYCNRTLEVLCEDNRWSYFWTEENRIAQTQNLAIRSHPDAKWIYKMDEDIFVTPGMFEELMRVYMSVQSERKYAIGIVAPQMAVNDYSYCRILDYLKCREEYEKTFGDAYFGRGSIYSRGEAAEYMWRKTLPLNGFAERMKEEAEEYSICWHRFSIGCFLMHRSFWQGMKGFMTAPEGVLGIDEEYLCRTCMISHQAIIVAERAIAGHFAYGQQTEHMKQFYNREKEKFCE